MWLAAYGKMRIKREYHRMDELRQELEDDKRQLAKVVVVYSPRRVVECNVGCVGPVFGSEIHFCVTHWLTSAPLREIV